MIPAKKAGRLPIFGRRPAWSMCLGSEVAEARTETIEGVLIGIRRCSETSEAVGISRRHRSEAGEGVFISRRHRSEAGEASKGRHRHHSKAASKGRLHRAEVGILRVESVKAGIHDFDRYFGFSHGGLGFFLSGGFTRGPALGAPFGSRKLRGCFICFCRQDCRPGDAGLSSEDLHKAKKTNGQNG